MKNNTGWLVLYVKSRHEQKVHIRLQESGVDSFLPMVTTFKQWSDRKKKVLKPLFSSYVFVNIKSSMDFHKTLSIDGACCYISFAGKCAKVPEKEINRIKHLVGSKEISDIKTNFEYPKEGEIKKIMHGPLSGLECLIVKANNRNKIVVKIDSIKQKIMATIPAYYLAPVLQEAI